MSTSDIHFSRIPGAKSSKSSESRTGGSTPFGVPKASVPPLNGEFQSQSAPIQSNSPGNMIISVAREDLEIHTPKRESPHVKSTISTSSVSHIKPMSLSQTLPERQTREIVTPPQPTPIMIPRVPSPLSDSFKRVSPNIPLPLPIPEELSKGRIGNLPIPLESALKPIYSPQRVRQPIAPRSPVHPTNSVYSLPLPTVISRRVDPVVEYPQVSPVPVSMPVESRANTSSRPNYLIMDPEQQLSMKLLFRSKFATLQASFPSWKINEAPDSATLDQVHDLYESYVKSIMNTINSSQWRVCLIIGFLAIEVFGIKVLGLDFRGYAESQFRVMNRYDHLLIELGEKYFSSSGSGSSIETRFMGVAVTSAFSFVIVKYLSKWLGGDAMVSTVQNVVDSAFSGVAGVISNSSVQKDENGLPVLPQATPQGGGMGNIGSMLSGMFNGGSPNSEGGGFDLSGLVAGLGSMMTKNMKPSSAQASSSEKPGETIRPASSKKKVVF
jgi:hypothetical protein